MTIKTVKDKTDALKLRQQQSSCVNAAVHKLEARAQPESCASGVLCKLWRAMRGARAPAAAPASKLSEAADAMNRRIVELESRAAECRQEAVDALRDGKQKVALRALRKAKVMEAQVVSNQSALDAVETQVDMLAQADMQKQLASALSTSGKGLRKDKKLLKRAEDALEDATEVRDMADDLNGVMNEFATSAVPEADDDDLLLELQSMASAAKRTDWEECEAVRARLPVAPAHPPRRAENVEATKLLAAA